MIARTLRPTAWLGLAGFIGVVLLQHVISSGLRPDEHVISEYANGDAGPLMVVGFIGWAMSLAAASLLTLHRGLRTRLDPALGVLAVCLALAAAGATVMAIFPTQAVASVVPPGTPRTTTGRLHDGGSGLLSVALLLACAASATAVEFTKVFRQIAVGLLGIAVLADVVLLAAGDAAPGVRQRVLVAAACCWQIALVAQLSRRRGGSESGRAPLSCRSRWALRS